MGNEAEGGIWTSCGWCEKREAGPGRGLSLGLAAFPSLSSLLPTGKELVLFIRPLSQSCEPDRLSQDLDNFEIQDIISECECCEQTRFSVLSTDSGIERDLPLAAEEPFAPCSADTEQSRLQRKGGIKKKPSPLESMAFLQAGCNGPGAKPAAKAQKRTGVPTKPPAPLQRLHTARVVLLGDDRLLGRLAQAYHSLRCLAGGHRAAAWGNGVGVSLCCSSQGGWGWGWALALPGTGWELGVLHPSASIME